MPLDQHSDDPPSHQHCYHAIRAGGGIVAWVIPKSHIVEICCKCDSIRTIHVDHAADGCYTTRIGWS